MVNVIKRGFSHVIRFILSKVKPKKIKETKKGRVHAYQDSFFGFLLTMHNNVNLYNINFNALNKEEKIKVLDEMSKDVNHYFMNGELDEIKDIKPF